MKKGLLLFILFSLSILNLQAQMAVTIVKVDSLKPGDVFPYIIVVKKNNRQFDKIVLPDSAAFGSDFEIRSYMHFKPSGNTDSLVYQLQYFGVGDRQLPEVPVHLVKGEDTLTVKTDVVPVFYQKLVADDAGGDSLKPFKPIFEFASRFWLLIVITLLVIALLWFLYKRFYSKQEIAEVVQPKEIPPFNDPFKEFDFSIEEIKNGESLKQGEYKIYYTELTDAVRQYMERVYKENALEMTSSEISYAMKRKRLDSQVQSMIMMLLNQADRVKFAKYDPIMESAINDLDLAIDLGKRFRSLDRQKVAMLREEYEIENGLRQPLEQSANDEMTTTFDMYKNQAPSSFKIEKKENEL